LTISFQFETPEMSHTEEKYFAASQHIGARARQEDYFAFAQLGKLGSKDSGVLMVVADGMGGHEGGSFASRLAANSFVDTFLKSSAPNGERLESALIESNEAIRRGTEAAIDMVGCMGTTLVGMLVTAEGLQWVSVGDSPAFLFRDGQIRRLNEDHSFRPMIEDQIERGIISREQARTHPNRNTLRSAVTGYPIDLVDLRSEPVVLRDDDVIICASDGLFSVSNAALVKKLKEIQALPAREIAAALVKLTRGMEFEYQDNVTGSVIKPKPWTSKVKVAVG
jgi:serine/threonine protein phosphatase PrpC